MALNYINQIRSTIFRSINRNSLRNTYQIKKCTFKTKSTTEVKQEEDENKPIPYSTSPAAQWAARHSQSGANDDNVPWYQPHIVIWSCVCFLMYFGYLREPNDIDEVFEKELGDYFPEHPGEAVNKQLEKK